MAVTAPADRRLKRSQVSPSRRRRMRRPLWQRAAAAAVTLAVLGGVAYAAVDYARSAEALTVGTITVEGAKRLSRGDVLAVLADLRGTRLGELDLEQWQARVLDLPWVGEASLRRVLPDTVAVTLIEREPMAVARLGSALYLLDWNGRLIDAFGPDYADLDLPLVDGVGTPGPPAPAVDRERAALAVRVLAAVRSSSALADRISQVDVTDVRDAVVILEGDTALVRIGRERFAERLESYLDIVPVLRERVPAIDYVDLRFDERVYVRPLEGPGADAGPGARGRGPSGS
jgi:cell division septal protein FtsQ